MKAPKQLIALAACAALLAGCRPDPERREREYMPDMYRNQAVKPQEEFPFFRNGLAMQHPPAGTVPVNFDPYPYAVVEQERAEKELANPLPATKEVLEMGRKYYSIHCVVCHGATGAGNGLATIANREFGMPIPPQLYSEKVRKEWKDGRLFHIITKGQGQMPAYGARIEPAVRWAIVHYVRALGVAAMPEEADLKLVEQKNLKPGNIKEMDEHNPYTLLPKPAASAGGH